jgi:hypothetical protein
MFAKRIFEIMPIIECTDEKNGFKEIRRDKRLLETKIFREKEIKQ